MKTATYIKNLKESFVRITETQENALIKYWGKNIGNEFSEQDIWEQLYFTKEKIIDGFDFFPSIIKKLKIKKITHFT